MTNAFSAPASEVTSIFELLPESLQANLKSQGILQPTPIQQKSFDIVVKGHDLIAQSRTGSGKTLAFGLPSFLKLEKPKAGHPRLLVLTPTRELASQVADVFDTNFRPLGFRTLAVTGGKSYRFQQNMINKGLDVVVATPGRLTDLLEQRILNLSSIEVLVLDEMDEMLDFGFAEDILKIKEFIGKKVQTLLFSATFPPKVNQIARQMVQSPKEIKIENTETNNSQIEHGFLEVKVGRNLDALLALLLFHAPEHALIFCRTRDETKKIYNALSDRGFSAGVLNGEMTQADRSVTFERFRDRHLKILVATDVAARGIDVSGLSHVINFSVPNNPETYTHRVGRTGRAGASGKAWTIIPYNERREFQFICTKAKINPERLEVPTSQKIASQFVSQMTAKVQTKAHGIPEHIEVAVEKYVNSLDETQQKEILAATLKSQAVRQLGKVLHVDDIAPASKTPFGAAVKSDRPTFGGGNGGGYGGRGGRGGSSRGRSDDRRSGGRSEGRSGGRSEGRSERSSYKPRGNGGSQGHGDRKNSYHVRNRAS